MTHGVPFRTAFVVAVDKVKLVHLRGAGFDNVPRVQQGRVDPSPIGLSVIPVADLDLAVDGGTLWIVRDVLGRQCQGIRTPQIPIGQGDGVNVQPLVLAGVQEFQFQSVPVRRPSGDICQCLPRKLILVVVVIEFGCDSVPHLFGKIRQLGNVSVQKDQSNGTHQDQCEGYAVPTNPPPRPKDYLFCSFVPLIRPEATHGLSELAHAAAAATTAVSASSRHRTIRRMPRRWCFGGSIVLLVVVIVVVATTKTPSQRTIP